MAAKFVSSIGRHLALLFVALTTLVAFSSDARAGGSFKLKSTSANEVSGAWHIFVTVELSRAPATAHVPMKFLFTKEVVLERALVDGHEGPVTNRVVLQNQTPQVESLDVDFADGSGKIFKGTRFDFGLTRDRGYEAGEYKVQVRTSDGTDVGGAQRITLNGDNPVVDRRAITFNASNKAVKKVESGIDGGAGPKTSDEDAPGVQAQDVQASGSATPFIPPDAYNKTPEEEIKTHPAGCGCVVAGAKDGPAAIALGVFGVAWALAYARSRKRG